MRLAKQSECIPLQNVVYFIKLPFLVRKIFTFYINDVLLQYLNVHFQGQKVKSVQKFITKKEINILAVKTKVRKYLKQKKFELCWVTAKLVDCGTDGT